MLTYIYFVKCPGCEDEHFDFFNDAKDFAMGCLSQKPIITQTEVDRNDFGECVNSCDLGTVWSWEELMDKETEAEPTVSVFTKDDLKNLLTEEDPEFTALDNSLEDTSFSSVEDAIDFLVKDEEEAIAGYEKVKATVKAIGAENKKEILDTLDHIKTEEEEHIDELKASVEKSATRRPVPEGMTVEQLVEEMEENEDAVECTWCEELFDKSECRREVNLGWLCDRCQAAIMSRGEPLTFRENDYWDFLDESMDPRELVELEYPSLTATIYGAKRDVDDWDEEEYTSSHVFLVPKVEVATAIWENWITEEDAKDIEGGLEALEDDSTWEKFLEAHFDDLFEKYEQQILAHFKDEAEEDFRERSQEEYQMNNLAAAQDRAYDEWRDERLFSESAQKPDDYRKHLTMCPECGDNSFDTETGICVACGFN